MSGKHDAVPDRSDRREGSGPVVVGTIGVSLVADELADAAAPEATPETSSESSESSSPASDATPPSASGGPRWGLLALLAVAAGLVATLVWPRPRGDTARPTAPPPTTVEPRPGPTPPEATAGDTAAPEATAGDTGASEAGEDGPVQPPLDGPRDPRVIPAGTPEAHAKAFSKIPVSIYDGPPVGGIGSSGMHIDRVDMGRRFESSKCVDATTRFSIAGDGLANVCFRVVHSRVEETVRVIWEKDGRIARRGKVRIRPVHGYRTRAYLKLRPEYIGTWRVRIVPEGEDVELASVEFAVVE